MSIAALNWAFKAQIKNPGAKFVLISLANYADENNQCFPSNNHISKMTGISSRSINEHLTFLEIENLIKRVPRFLDNGRQTSSVYEINLDTLRNPQGEAAKSAGGEGDDVAGPYTQEEETKEETHMPTSPKTSNIGLVTEIFDYWKEALKHPRAKLDAKRKRLIQARIIIDKYSADDLRQAIRGLTHSPHHMGQNDTGMVYDDITLICRDATHVERFMALDEKPTEMTGQKSAAVTYESPEERNWRESIGYYGKQN